MVQFRRIAFGGALVALGYLLGTFSPFTSVRAQEAGGLPSDDAAKKILDVNDKLKGAVDILKLESRYEAVTKAANPYAVLVGGLNAKEDLDAGHGVDPDTFAALYVAAFDMKKLNLRDDTLAEWVDISQLDYDGDGRLTYGGKVVRIYPVSRLKKLRAQRMVLSGDVKK